MSLESARVFVAITLLFSVVPTSGYAQAVKSDAAQWRTSFDTFVKDIDEYPLSDVPYAKPEAGGLIGKRVSGDAAIMKRFGGKVEFEGTFQGVVTDDSFLDPQKKIKKIDISMAWPSGRNPSGYWSLHLYPKAGSLKAWRALKPKTTVKFRAVVTGITWYQVWIPAWIMRFPSSSRTARSFRNEAKA